MTSLIICYPDVPASALVVSANRTYDEDRALVNTYYGERGALAYLSSSQTSVVITYDLGTGNTRTVDHFILGQCSHLKGLGVTEARLQGSSNGSTWVNQLGTASGFATRTFDGIEGRDLIFTAAYNDQLATALAAYRYFRVTLSGSSNVFGLSKIYFGASFDMGKEPDYYEPDILTERDADTWRYPRGQVLMTKAYYPAQRFQIEWDGVTDAKAAEFSTKILANPFRHHVFLYAATYQDPLFGSKLVHCRVLADDCEIVKKKENWNTVSLVCEELV